MPLSLTQYVHPEDYKRSGIIFCFKLVVVAKKHQNNHNLYHHLNHPLVYLLVNDLIHHHIHDHLQYNLLIFKFKNNLKKLKINFGGWQMSGWQLSEKRGWQMSQKGGWQLSQKRGWRMSGWHMYQHLTEKV